ncbi:S-layer homology domain-containing protein [Paenibacillus hexagrammi]|uniref:S-layer homology domain-containing protein n=1 Tax=Paenibacillus hexagrammi TaxID=2908839 RepID=A0ABY3SEB7_9BACL|nr:S-layer homology domain-containing protein [Paenibacillus sp. YPD9-1]UJF31491.1 S-layer homology domain-containing protein [Paenibacillus sp. YPD9-1]
MKTYKAAFIALLLTVSPLSAHAASSVALNISAAEVLRGGEIDISGTVDSNVHEVSVKIISPAQTVFYIDHISASEGSFSKKIAISTNEDFTPYGVYSVVAGTEDGSVVQTFSVVDEIGGGPETDPGSNHGGHSSSPGSSSNAANPESNTSIPLSAGTMKADVLKPDLAEDGRYLIGSATWTSAIEQASGSITIELPASSEQSGQALEFPAEVLQSLKEKELDLIIKSESYTMRFPAGSIPASGEAGQRLRIMINSVWSDEAKDAVLSSIKSNPDYHAPGMALSVEIQTISGDQSTPIHKLNQPAEVTFKLTSEQAKQISSNLAGVYQVDGGRPEYVGGYIHDGEMTFKAGHFSTYTILELEKKFVDTSRHWAEPSIKSLAAKHIVSGVDDQHYEPNRGITRAEFVTLLMRAHDWTGQTPNKAGSNPFSDVAAGQYYSGQVAKAASLGIISGYNGAFRPADSITREEAVVALVNAKAYFNLTQSDKGTPRFEDQDEISDWAKAAVKEAFMAGLIEGDGTHFNPKQSVTRAEVAAMIQRLLPSGSL